MARRQSTNVLAFRQNDEKLRGRTKRRVKLNQRMNARGNPTRCMEHAIPRSCSLIKLASYLETDDRAYCSESLLFSVRISEKWQRRRGDALANRLEMVISRVEFDLGQIGKLRLEHLLGHFEHDVAALTFAPH